MSRWAAILAGGSGTRFWPVSTSARPKQLLPLAGKEPMLRDAMLRLGGLIPAERILILTGAHLAAATRKLLPEIPAENVLAEPRPASTAPALAWATFVASSRDPDAVVISLHADWFIGDAALFRATAETAMDVAVDHDVLVTVGVRPTRPDTGYGYVEPGEALDERAQRVVRFTEKPNEAEARELISRGALWNTGMFAWTAGRFTAETHEHAPEVAGALDALDAGNPSGFFDRVTPVAVDISHFERSERVAVVPGHFPWDDVGTWSALARVRAHDDGDNVLVGTAIQHESRGCVAWAEDGVVVLDGVENLVVVRTDRVTLVTTAERAARLKDLLSVLPPEVRDG